MSEFIQKHKFNIHIAAEITCVLGIFLYISRKNKALVHEISYLNERVNIIENILQNNQQPPQQHQRPIWVATATAKPKQQQSKKVSFQEPPTIIEIDDEPESENDEDLDAELDLELQKLK